MKTERKEELKARMEKDKKKWIAVVKNTAIAEDEIGKVGFDINTNFYSDQHTFENVLHKIELDLMTNLHFGFKQPIEVKIVEAK